jgi:hypothetical protein
LRLPALRFRLLFDFRTVAVASVFDIMRVEGNCFELRMSWFALTR